MKKKILFVGLALCSVSLGTGSRLVVDELGVFDAFINRGRTYKKHLKNDYIAERNQLNEALSQGDGDLSSIVSALEGLNMDWKGVRRVGKRRKKKKHLLKDKKSVLHLAIELGKAELVDAMLDHAEGKNLLLYEDKKDRIPLEVAVERNKPEIVDMLLDAGSVREQVEELVDMELSDKVVEVLKQHGVSFRTQRNAPREDGAEAAIVALDFFGGIVHNIADDHHGRHRWSPWHDDYYDDYYYNRWSPWRSRRYYPRHRRRGFRWGFGW